MTTLNEIQELDIHFNIIADKLRNSDSINANESKKTNVEKHITETQVAIDIALNDATPEAVTTINNTVNLFSAWAHQIGVLIPMMRVNKESNAYRADRNDKLARVDALTQSGNRLAFSEQLAVTLKKQEKNPDIHTAVFLFDLDRFKGLNDKYGHDTGDAALKTFAQSLKGMTRGEDRGLGKDEGMADSIFVPPTSHSKKKEGQSDFRFGGDEFAIIMSIKVPEGTDPKEQFEKIQNRMKEQSATLSCFYKEQTFPILSSIGMHIVDKNDTAEYACKVADNNLMEHKETKKERYEYCHNFLEEQNAPNLQEVEDKRTNEATRQKFEQAGEAICRLGKTPGIEIHVPQNIDPDELETLEAAGFDIVYKEPEI